LPTNTPLFLFLWVVFGPPPQQKTPPHYQTIVPLAGRKMSYVDMLKALLNTSMW
jgi:hypothetical protein